uniref:Ig-like domain-containing protein n=1 Tax=Pygocentrus nattereri TaxID=42514 RepID=A0AAR2LIH1_PYGNA
MGFCFGVDYITLYKLTEKGKQLKVTLECAMTTDESANIQWYRQTKLEESNLIYDSGDPSLSTNTNIDILNTSLTISEFTEEDSGMYWCVVLLDSTDYVVSKPTFTTKIPRNRMITDMDSAPEPDSESGTLLYAVIAVVGLVILLLIAVGVVLKLRARRRAADQSRTESSEQQTVSEPLVNLKSLH